MKQASLDIHDDKENDFIVSASNDAAYQLFMQYQQSSGMVLISGVASSGKTLLAKYWVDNPQYLVSPDNPQDIIALAHQHISHIAIDDVDRCDFLNDELLFHFYNIINKQEISVLLTSSQKHSDLLHCIMLADWRTRFASILSAHIDDSDEELLLGLMARKCQQHYIVPNMNLLHYLLSHYPRQYKTMLNIMDRLINHANSKQQKLTIPFAKDVLSTFTS